MIPDCIRFLIRKKKIILRNPNFSRPWQLVLEPLKGYLILAAKQYKQPLKYSGSWNFGIQTKSTIKVKEIVNLMIKFWGVGKVKVFNKSEYKEQKNLLIDSSKAKKYLNWKCSYNIKKAVKVTTEWYSKVLIDKINPIDITIEQINEYVKKS